VRASKTSFVLCKLGTIPTRGLQIANLMFDSDSQMAIAGIRGSAASARQLLYKSGSFCIDMQVQPKPGSDDVILVGQLLDSAKFTQGVGDVPVTLICGGDMVSRKRTNNFGEFDFGFEASRNVHLLFGLAEHRTIMVPVPDPSFHDVHSLS